MSDCVTLDTITYSWFMPELTVASCWAQEEWFIDLLKTNIGVEEKINHFKDYILGDDYSFSKAFIFDKKMEVIFGNPVYANNFIALETLFEHFPRIEHLCEYLNKECPNELITGSAFIGKNSLKDYVRAVLFDLIDKHVNDVNRILEEHYNGGIELFLNSTFVLRTSEKVLRCELENLIYSASRFNCNDVEIIMLPIII